jgi:hypothetical protein
MADSGNRFAANKKAPGDLQRLRLFSHQRWRRLCVPIIQFALKNRTVGNEELEA